MDKITSWSFSRWATYQECPRKAFYKFIKKLKEPGSAAMDRGSELHAQCEKYLKAGGRIPKTLAAIGDILKRLRKEKAEAEVDATFRRDWSLTRWDDWNGAWCRVKIDAQIPPIIDSDEPTVKTYDFKTGKIKDDTSEYGIQLELYGLSGLLRFPTAEKSESGLIFIDHGKEIPCKDVFFQKDVKKLQKKWETRIRPMFADTKFKPRPGNACRWCHFRKSNEGPCEF